MLEPKKKVLVVDDEVHIRRVLQVKLEKQGFEVVLCKNGQEGYENILKHEPDIAVFDINMPIMDGQILCLKTDPIKKERDFLTIIVSARIDPEKESWVKDMTHTVFMEKPFSPAKIVACIEEYLGNK